MKMRIIAGMISFVLLFSFTLPSFVDTDIASEDDGIIEEYIPEINIGVELSNIDVSGFGFKIFEEEYDFLVNDPVFLQLEATVSKPRV